MKSVKANYYDGHSARQHAVTLNIANSLLEICGTEISRQVPIANIRISAKLGNAPRLLHFSDEGHCEINDHANFEALLTEAGLIPQSLLSRWENSWRHALAAALFFLAFIFATFYWGLPWAAEIAAARIPASVALNIDSHVLRTVDHSLMQASELSKARQQTLRKNFDGLGNATGLGNAAGFPAHQLEFRSSKALGANAFALPGGTIIVTDQLVALASDDEEIFAVLAHELGHVSARHPLRQLLQSSVVGLVMTWYLGDISNLLAAAPALLLDSRYSRDFERSADRYAANMLRTNGIAPTRLADMLEKLEAAHFGAQKNQPSSFRITQFLSTHPDTDERVNELRRDALR